MSLIRWRDTRDLPTFPSDLLSMQREINRLFGNFFRTGWSEDTDLASAAWAPAADIVEHEDAYVVNVELPGVLKNDVKITMQDNVLTIRGEKKEERESKGVTYHRGERSYGAFQRCFTLPSSVKADAIEAAYRDGILTVTLPKAEEAKPRRIEVSVK